jgi:hypothetical protein
VCVTVTWSEFSQLHTAAGEMNAMSSVNLIKSETAVKMDYKYTCKDFYTFVLKEKDILKAAKSNKKYV